MDSNQVSSDLEAIKSELACLISETNTIEHQNICIRLLDIVVRLETAENARRKEKQIIEKVQGEDQQRF